MDGFSFDALTRSLTTAGSRRRALVLVLSGALVPLLTREGADAHNALLKCKKLKGKKKKKCVKKAKKHNAEEAATGATSSCTRNCAGKTCGNNDGGSCGTCAAPRTSCANGRCACPEDECQGNCIVSCRPGEARNPGTCTCCIAAGDPCFTSAFATPCCSGS